MPPSLRQTTRVSGDAELLDAVLDAATSMIVVTDTEGRLVRWNRACEQILGYTAADMGAKGAMLDLVPAAERGAAEATIRALLAGESPVPAELHWRTRNGDLRLIEWSTTVLTGPDGTVTHLVGTGIDVTETRRLEVERAASAERLQHIADHDALTGLFNRRRFEEELARHLAHGRRYGMSGALLLMDLDGFKEINDEHGHRAGDTVLASVATILADRLRESDIVARFGGDEFAVLMPAGGEDEAAELAEVLASAISREVPTPTGPLRASVGYSVFGEKTTSDDVLSRADDAMYSDKARNTRERRLRSVE